MINIDVRVLWQAQSLDPFQMSPEEIRLKMKRLNRKLLLRDSLIYVICFGEAVWCTRCFLVLPQLLPKTGSFLKVLAMAFLASQIWINQRSRKASCARAEAPANINSLDFYRIELERERDFHRGVWFWSRLAVVLPGLLVFGIGAIVESPQASIGYELTLVTLILCAIAIRLNRVKSQNYQRQIDALDALRQPPD